ncbi:MAG: metallophosphoesterase [Clostridia bacterium]|nr:metallophosphoesterase [Clostridia bacterium]
MRIIVLSDSHGNSYNIRKAIDRQPKAELVVFLGDGEWDFKNCHIEKPSIAVKGNCDWGSELPAYIMTQEKGYNIYCTHGYAENVKYGNEWLKMRAEKYQAHIALYGHTHNPVTFYEDGIWFVNPGSIGEGSYAVIDLEDSGIMPVLMKI